MSMGIVAAGVGVVGNLIASDNASSAASSAANAQTAASNAQIAANKSQFDSIQKLLSPYVQAGSGTPTTSFDQSGYDTAMQQYQQKMAQWNGQGGQPSAAGNPYAGRTVSDAELNSMDASQYQQYQAAQSGAAGGTMGGLTAAPVAPTRDQFTTATGQTQGGALQAQQSLLGLNGNDAQQASIDGIKNSSQFNSLVKTGENSILQNASATGGLRGGNAQAALAQFSPALLQSLVQQQYSNLSSLTSMGQNAAAGVGNAGLSLNQSSNAALSGIGSAQAGAALANGTASNNAVNGIASGVGQLAGSGALSKLFGNTAPSYASQLPAAQAGVYNAGGIGLSSYSDGF